MSVTIRDVARRAGVSISTAPHLKFDGDYTKAVGFAAAESILRSTPRPTLIVAANDSCASGVISVLNDVGLTVPGDISVAGFDDVPSSHYTLPPLTTARVPIREIGYGAFRRLVARPDGRVDAGVFRQHVLPVELAAWASAYGAGSQRGGSSSGGDVHVGRAACASSDARPQGWRGIPG